MKGAALKGFLMPFLAVIGLIVCGLILVRLGLGPNLGQNTEVGALDTDASTAAEDGQALPVGKQAPDLMLVPFGKNREPAPLSALLREHKVLVLNFWATWCAPCKIEMPSLSRLRKKFSAQGLEVIAINVDDDPDATVPASLKSMKKVDLPIFLDPEQKATEAFEVQAIPFTVVLGPDLKVLYSFMGEKDWSSDEFQERVGGWLAKGAR